MDLKPSAYNISTAFDDADHRIVYNTRTGALAFASGAAASVLRQRGPIDNASLANLTDDDLTQMFEAGFLVGAGRNEFVEVEAEYCLQQQDASVLALCIAPTYSCNLMCPYCYEEGRNASDKIMDAATQDSIVAFAQQAFGAEPYERIEVQWYGGEPLLAPAAIERISKGLMGFCEERGLGFSANMVSNATRIGAEEAALLRECCVDNVLVTIDGPEAMHNQRRPARDGSNSFEAACDGIGNLIREYIDVMVVMNTDRANDPLFDELNEQLKERFGLSAMRTKLNDYYGTFGNGRFSEPGFSLMDHREFTNLQCSRFCEEVHAPQDFANLLQPIPLFCRGQMERYYCIDAMGDVYKCDGRMGRTDHVLFSLADIASADDIPTGTAPVYPFDDDACVACALLPVCKGTCEWERKRCEDHPCHPLKYNTTGYLRGWAHALGYLFAPDRAFLLLSSMKRHQR